MPRINRRVDIEAGVVHEITELIAEDIDTGNEVVTAREKKVIKESPDQYEARLIKEKENAEHAITVIAANISELKEAKKDPEKMRAEEVVIPADTPESQQESAKEEVPQDITPSEEIVEEVPVDDPSTPEDESKPWYKKVVDYLS